MCAAALVTPYGSEHVETGALRGTLLREPLGDGGFGYDPVLLPQGSDRSVAQLTRAEKNAVSHRGIAMRALLPHLLTALDPASVPD